MGLNCTVVIVGSRKYNDENAKEWAEAAGLKFIKLKYFDPGTGQSAGIHTREISGWQYATVTCNESSNGALSYSFELSKKAAPRTVSFVPDQVTRIMYAYIVDTPYNRKNLVATYFHHAYWKIEDPEIDKEIRTLATEAEKNIKPAITREQIILTQDEEIANLKKDLAEIRSMNNKKLLVENEVEKIKQTQVVEKKKPTPDARTEKPHKDDALWLKAKEAVYNEKAKEFEDLKKSNPKHWIVSKEYKENFLTPIRAKYEALLNANTGNSLNN
jgi:hypothetical protein